MKKILLLCLLLVFSLGALPAAANPLQSPVDNFTGLAAYFSAEAPMFLAMRTDDAYLDELDAVIGHVAKALPGVIPPNFSVKQLYDLPVDSSRTVGQAIRPWLGSAAAVGINGSPETLMSSTPPLLIVVEITDRAAAETFWSGMLGSSYNTETVNGYTVYTPNNRFISGSVAVGDKVLLISLSNSITPEMPRESLAQSARFTGALAQMPADSYNILVYSDAASFTIASMQQMFSTSNPRMAAIYKVFNELFDALLSAQGPQMIGFTTLDGRTLTMDMAQMRGDTSKLEALGLNLYFASDPVDVNFAARVPADAPLVLQGSNIGPMMINGIKNFRTLGDYLQDQGIVRDLLITQFVDPENAELANDLINIGHLITFFELSFAGMTGLNFENDVLAWMDGDFASYLRIVPSEKLLIAPDFAVIVESSDAQAPAATISKLVDALNQYRLKPSVSSDGSTIIFSDLLRWFAPPYARNQFSGITELDLLLGSRGSLAAFGTRRAVEYSLSSDTGGLAADPSFIAAQAYFLPGAQSIAYANLNPLVPVLERTRLDPMAAALLGLFESGSITSIINDEVNLVRFVLTISG